MKKCKVGKLESINEIQFDPKKLSKNYNKLFVILDDLPYDFRKRLRYFRECLGITREKLEETSYISVQTIKEIEINRERGYSIETIISLCIGMKLPPELSFDLLRIGGFNIENSIVKKNYIYSFILRNLYNYKIDDINIFLKVNNISPLSEKGR